MTDHLPYRSLGDGPALLLVHGAAEDAAILAPQAEAFAHAGRRVGWYDRRGTGVTPRDGWPGGGVAQHADDAAALVRELGGPVQVLGFSSGGVVAMALAARHPDLDVDVVAWEPPVVRALNGGAELHAQMTAPIDAYLAEHPDDWRGAFGVMLEIVSGGEADLASPEAVAQMANAEAAIRDDARVITEHEFALGELPAARVRLARGRDASDLHRGIIARLEAAHGLETVVVEKADDHEVYIKNPDVLAGVDWSR